MKKIQITSKALIKNRADIVKELSKTRKNGIILDLIELEGCYALKNSAEIFEMLNIKDELIVDNTNPLGKDMLTVTTKEGIVVGFIKPTTSLLLDYLQSIEHGISCFVEYIDYKNELLTIIVSVYVQNY